MDDDLIFSVPGQLYSSKNSRLPLILGKKRVCVKSKAAAADYRRLRRLFRLNGDFVACWKKELSKRKMPYRIEFKIYRARRGRFDYTNIKQNLLDAMVAEGLLPDDDADTLIPVDVPYGIDREHPRTDIRIL